MNLRPGRWVLALAVVAAATGVLAFVLRPRPIPVLVVDGDLPVVRPDDRPSLRNEWETARTGGTYGGRVVDADGRPVPGADVLLVGVDKDAKVTYENLDADGTGETLDIPVFGYYRTAARARTDAEGRFSVAAGDALIVAIFAWQRNYAPGLLSHTAAHPLAPGPDHELRLAAAGWLRAKVVDAVTKAPVAGAEAVVYLQSAAHQAGRAGPVPFTPTNAFARFATYVGRELGPLVWGLQAPEGDTGFHVRTDAAGTFAFGPVMQEVQLEVVVTHPEYMWTDMDGEVVFPSDNPGGGADKPLVGRRVRTVIPAGQTVERTYALTKGKEVSGTVVDAQGQPLEGVTVGLEHVSQYAQHPWYRTHSRFAITDAKGRFRIAGLSYEPYTLHMTHPSIESSFFHGVLAGSDTVYKIEGAGGWVDVTVEGGPPEGKPFSVRAVLEPVDRRSARREESQVVREGKMTIERIRPGRYDLFVVSGTRISDSARIEVRGIEGVTAVLRLTDGGSVRIPVQDPAGSPLDPATVELEAVRAEGNLRRAAVVVARQGLASAEGLLPGTYRARARAMGFVPGESAPFEVASDRTTNVPAVVLRRQGYVQVTGVSSDDGKPVTVYVALSVKQGEGEFERQKALVAGLIPVHPGPVTLKAEASDGRKFEKVLTVGDGETLPVEILLAK